jgi:hypothetical protein
VVGSIYLNAKFKYADFIIHDVRESSQWQPLMVVKKYRINELATGWTTEGSEFESR